MFKYIRQHNFGDPTIYLGKAGEIVSDDDGNLFTHDGVTVGGNILPKTVVVNLSAAQLLSCNTNPIEVIAAPGIGKAIALFCVATSSFKGSVGFTGGANSGLYYSIGAFAITTDPFAVITNGRNTFTVSNLTVPNNAASWKMDNSSVIFTADGNFAAGNGSATITIVYSIVPLANNGLGDF